MVRDVGRCQSPRWGSCCAERATHGQMAAVTPSGTRRVSVSMSFDTLRNQARIINQDFRRDTSVSSACLLNLVTHQSERSRAGRLDHLQPAKYVALGIGERLALLEHDGPRELVVVVTQECLKPTRDQSTRVPISIDSRRLLFAPCWQWPGWVAGLGPWATRETRPTRPPPGSTVPRTGGVGDLLEHDGLPPEDRRIAPLILPSGLSSVHDFDHVFERGFGHAGEHALGGRVVDVDEGRS